MQNGFTFLVTYLCTDTCLENGRVRYTRSEAGVSYHSRGLFLPSASYMASSLARLRANMALLAERGRRTQRKAIYVALCLHCKSSEDPLRYGTGVYPSTC